MRIMHPAATRPAYLKIDMSGTRAIVQTLRNDLPVVPYLLGRSHCGRNGRWMCAIKVQQNRLIDSESLLVSKSGQTEIKDCWGQVKETPLDEKKL
jgi:hypothetical protein